MTEQHYQQQPPPAWQPQQAPKQRHAIRNVVLGVVIGGLLLLGGCVALIGAGLNAAEKEAEKVTGTAPTQPPPAVTTPAPTDDSPPAAQETTPPPDEPGIAKIGATQWFTYEDGLKVQVTKVTTFKMTSFYGGGKPGDKGVIVIVTIKNGTAAAFDANLADVKLTSGPNGDQADTVIDIDRDLTLGFTGTIPVGRSKTARIGFAIPKTHKTVTVEVTPSWDHAASHYEGTIR